MAETPTPTPTPTTRKRAVPATRPKASPAAPRKPLARKPKPKPLEDEAPITNYALRLTEQAEAPEDEQSSSSFELRLSEALKAINAAQGLTSPEPEAGPEALAIERPKTGLATWLAALDKLPPIRLPIGPAIPWRVGLPLMFVLVISMGLTSRFASSSGEPAGVRLPATQPTTVLATSTPVDLTAGTAAAAIPATSADIPPTVAPETVPTAEAPAPAPAPQPIGVQEPAGSFDIADIAIKLIAVLALAYGSLMLLKRFGFGGASGMRSSGSGQGVKVVASIALAPNRSVHVIKTPGGRTLLVGSTPNAVNLLTELDEHDLDHG